MKLFEKIAGATLAGVVALSFSAVPAFAAAKDDYPAKPPAEKIKVYNPWDLTDQEVKALQEKVKEANPEALNVTIQGGVATLLYKDISTNTLDVADITKYAWTTDNESHDVPQLPLWQNNGNTVSAPDYPWDTVNLYFFRGDTAGLVNHKMYLENLALPGNPKNKKGETIRTPSISQVKLNADGRPYVEVQELPKGLLLDMADSGQVKSDADGSYPQYEIKVHGTVALDAKLGDHKTTYTVYRASNNQDKSVGKMYYVVKPLKDKYEPVLDQTLNNVNKPIEISSLTELTSDKIKGANAVTFKAKAKASDADYNETDLQLPEGTKLVPDSIDPTKIGVAQEITVNVKYKDDQKGDSIDTVKMFVKINFADPVVVAVDDVAKLTAGEKDAVKAAVKAANPNLPETAKVEVADNGKVTISYADGSSSVIEPGKTVRAKTAAEKAKPGNSQNSKAKPGKGSVSGRLGNTGTEAYVALICFITMLGAGMALVSVRKKAKN